MKPIIKCEMFKEPCEENNFVDCCTTCPDKESCGVRCTSASEVSEACGHAIHDLLSEQEQGEKCTNCNSQHLQPSGSCKICTNCGTTTGCS